MNSPQTIARIFATVFAAGGWEENELFERAGRLLVKKGRWLRPLARRLVQAHPGAVRPRAEAIQAFLLADAGFLRAYHNDRIEFATLLGSQPAMVSSEITRHWDRSPPLRTPGELSQWLAISTRQLAAFTRQWRDPSGQIAAKHQHYRYRLLAKRPGQFRLIEAPKPRLKAIQHQILDELILGIPPHDAAHGFRRGRSIATFADPHVGQRVVIKIDLQDFFPSIRAAQVHAFYRTMGYPSLVADLLTRLCTHTAPANLWEETPNRQARLYGQRHLPQGAPTSPALANLCAYRLDCRLTGLAAAVDARYTRYADDLVFSGGQDLARAARRFAVHACAIAMDEGFAIAHRKTRIMQQGVRQKVAGLVVNARPNVARSDFDRLKAILHNCVRHGPDSQNRDAHTDFRRHLEGRVSFVEMINPHRGHKLRALLQQIEW